MLKHLSVAVAVLVLAFPAYAQEYAIDQGSFILDGTVSFSSDGGDLYENLEGDRSNTVLLNPSALYFVAPGVAIGGELLVEYASQGEFSATAIGVGPEIAYFFGEADSSVYPFLAASVSYVSLSSDFFDASGIGFGLNAGAAFMLTRSVAISGSVGYDLQNLSVDQADETFSGNTFRLQLGVAAFLF